MMSRSFFLLKQLRADESGQDLIEYALAACLIGLGAVASIRSLASHLQSAFSSLATTLSSAV